METSCHILHIVFSLAPGGMENGIVNVARALTANYHYQVDVCCLEEAGVFAARLPATSRLTALEKPSGVSGDTVVRLRKIIRSTKPDVIHTHNLGPLLYTLKAVGIVRRPPIFHGEHAQVVSREQQFKYRLLRNIGYRMCSRIHTVSKGQKEELGRLGIPIRKISVIANGVDSAERFTPDGERWRPNRTTDKSLVIGIVGRFGAYKRHVALIQAFDRVATDHPERDMHLVLIGAGGPEEQSVMAAHAAAQNRKQIHLVGFQENPVPYYRGLDLLVVPSTNEGMSNAALEAMACGKPVLANNACGNDEVVSDAVDGFIRDMNSANSLYVCLSQATSERSILPAMGKRAREKVAHSFSISTMVNNYHERYAGLCRACRER